MRQSGESRPMGRVAIVAIVLLATVVLVFLATVVAYVLGVNVDAIAAVKNTIEARHGALTLLRLGAIGGVWHCWKPLCDSLFNDTVHLFEEKRSALFELRYTVLWGLLAIEVLVVQNVLGKVIGAMV
jgi:uncharacterized membrane protein YqjE